MGKVGNVEHAHTAFKRFIQCLAVKVARVFERIDRLPPDRIGGHQPQHHGIIPLKPMVARLDDRMRGQQRLAAPRGQAQTGIGDALKPLYGLVGLGIGLEPRGLFFARDDPVERRRRIALQARILEETG